MSDWTSLINLFGRFLLAFYFLKAGFSNALHFKKILNLIKTKKLLFPRSLLTAVIVTQILASMAIIFNYHTFIASVALIIFTLTANFLICNYWTMEGAQRKNVSFVFYANIAVIGALLLVTGISPRG